MLAFLGPYNHIGVGVSPLTRAEPLGQKLFFQWEVSSQKWKKYVFCSYLFNEKNGIECVQRHEVWADVRWSTVLAINAAAIILTSPIPCTP